MILDNDKLERINDVMAVFEDTLHTISRHWRAQSAVIESARAHALPGYLDSLWRTLSNSCGPLGDMAKDTSKAIREIIQEEDHD